MHCLLTVSCYGASFSISALGVSGGPDSMALCVLTAAWKTAAWKTAAGNAVTTDNGGFIDGLLAIIVDHGLRAESKEEAIVVSRRVSKMGMLCDFGCFIFDCRNGNVIWIFSC